MGRASLPIARTLLPCKFALTSLHAFSAIPRLHASPPRPPPPGLLLLHLPCCTFVYPHRRAARPHSCDSAQVDIGRGIMPAGYYVQRAGGLFPAPLPPDTDLCARAAGIFHAMGIFLAKVRIDRPAVVQWWSRRSCRRDETFASSRARVGRSMPGTVRPASGHPGQALGGHSPVDATAEDDASRGQPARHRLAATLAAPAVRGV